jgi:hypothetical protein
MASFRKHGKVWYYSFTDADGKKWERKGSTDRRVTERTAEMLRVDLQAAGIAYETASGVADFHALRAAYVTNLVASGASVKTCQTLSRHSTPSLTIGLYAKVSLHDVKEAVENLPELTPREPSPEPPAMTGTDPAVTPISERLSHHFPTGVDGTIRNWSDAGVMIGSGFESAMDHKPLEMAGLDADGQGRSDAGGNAPRRTRTYNPLIKSQLLCQLS